MDLSCHCGGLASRCRVCAAAALCGTYLVTLLEPRVSPKRFCSFRAAKSAACQLVSERASLAGAPGHQQGPAVWPWAGEPGQPSLPALQLHGCRQPRLVRNWTGKLHSCNLQLLPEGRLLGFPSPAQTAGAGPARWGRSGGCSGLCGTEETGSSISTALHLDAFLPRHVGFSQQGSTGIPPAQAG